MFNRLELFNQILQYASNQHIKLNRFWGSFVETTRFKLGESIKDIKVPFAVDSETSIVLDAAFKDLFEFLKRRNESQFKSSIDHSIDDVVGETRLAQKTYQIRFFRKDTMEYLITTRCLKLDPLLDAGIFETWLGPKNSGQNLITLLRGIYQKALHEEFKSEHLEKTAYIVHLGLIKHIHHAKAVIKKSSIKGLTYEQVDITFGTVLYVLIDAILQQVIDQLRTKPIPPHLGHSILLLTSTCHPFSFTSIKQSILRAKINPYNVSQELSNVLDPVYRAVSQENTDLNYVYPAMVKAAMNNSKIKNPLLEEATINLLRQTILEYLFENDNIKLPIPARLRTIIQDPAALYDFVFKPKEVDQFADQIKKQLKQEPRDDQRTQMLGEIEEVLRFIQKGVASRKAQALEELVQNAVLRYLTYKIDLYLDPFTSEAINLLENRQLKLNVTQLKQDYESGRLYRISSDTKPTLKEFTERAEGQLFIDLKDFTKRTQFSKEIVMADFLGTEFYKPILEAAKKYFSEVDVHQRGVRLTNLLGDAVIFSGSIEYLVHLAHDVQNIFKEYRNKLKASSPVNLESELKTRLERKYKVDVDKINDAINKTGQMIKDIRDAVQHQLSQNQAALSSQFDSQLNIEIGRLENAFIELDGKTQPDTTEQKRYEITALKNSVSQKLMDLRSLHKQFVDQYQKVDSEKQLTLLARFFFRDKLSDISNYEEYLETLQKRKNFLKYEFEKGLKRIEGFGIEAGLFISYGTAAEMVNLRDDVWGDQKVDIAETINESARGTARNPMIKKLLDARLSDQIRLRSKPDLMSPFSVYVENIFSIQLAPQHSNDLTAALTNGDANLAEQVLLNIYHEGLKEVRDQIKNPEAQEERRSLMLLSDIYNEGAAISEDALETFLRETSAARLPIRKKIPIRKFHPEILEKFVFLKDTCQFVLSVDLERSRTDPLVFRYAGHATFRGFENKGGIGIYEILKQDSPFYRLMIQHHYQDWLQEIPEFKKPA